MALSTIEVERIGAVGTLWLNRPQVHNAFDDTLIAELTSALAALDSDPGIRVVVLAGRGRSFCAGGDLGWMRRMAAFSPEENRQDASRLAEMLRTLADLSKPTVARVHGAALAGGTGLVAACDIVLATPEATFGTTEVRLGLIPATIGPYVIRAIGARAAQRYFLTGERFGAEEALRMGLVHEVCASNDLDARLQALLGTLVDGGPRAQAACKRLIAEVAGRSINAGLIAHTTELIAAARASEEAREGIGAFFAKRRPAWSD